MKEYNQIDILFFERPLVDLRKFAFKIAKHLKSIDDNLKLGAISIELPDAIEKDKSNIDYFYYRYNIDNLDEFLLKNNVKLIVFTQNRVPDLELILHAKKANVKTIMIQEGIMFDGTNINDINARNLLSIMLNYIPKTIEYLNIIRRMCWYDKRSFFKIVLSILKHKKDITTLLAHSFSKPLKGEYIFTIGEYWDDYYINRKGYLKNQIVLIGDHDLDGFQPSCRGESAICYVANVLVEDGTVKKSEFLEFINYLSECIDTKTKIYIKLHPRSDKTLYNALLNHNIEFVDKPGYLPSVNLYIGHRSALLGKALYESDNLIIWRFACEQVCFYEKYATFVCKTLKELKEAISQIDINQKSNEKVDIISKVYWRNPIGAMICAANNIYEYLKRN